MDLGELERFVVSAKRQTYVGGGKAELSCRPGSHDLGWQAGDWRYLDSYFGGSDFIGQEVVWHAGRPVWAMNYYGYILREDLIDAPKAGLTIKGALSVLYDEGRFLGGWRWESPYGVYEDASEGNVAHFTGREIIRCTDEIAYQLDYHGGLIRA